MAIRITRTGDAAGHATVLLALPMRCEHCGKLDGHAPNKPLG